ncbi:MAG: hypothetical protein QNI87_03320 [Erythrobacter sp.]|uniref:hypothetical protein n=1 Tax=Erythrobacter sp. TaxID=1042 RepID=UPI00261CFFA5|nr:hypothetical protein [Erythrobacter sp.]MDJ0977542.1 hypothetical protein [Erythrobacter sp.]
MIELDRIGALKAAAHLDAAIHQLRRDAARAPAPPARATKGAPNRRERIEKKQPERTFRTDFPAPHVFARKAKATD